MRKSWNGSIVSYGIFLLHVTKQIEKASQMWNFYVLTNTITNYSSFTTLSPNPLDIYQTRGDRNRTMGSHGWHSRRWGWSWPRVSSLDVLCSEHAPYPKGEASSLLFDIGKTTICGSVGMDIRIFHHCVWCIGFNAKVLVNCFRTTTSSRLHI